MAEPDGGRALPRAIRSTSASLRIALVVEGALARRGARLGARPVDAALPGAWEELARTP